MESNSVCSVQCSTTGGLVVTGRVGCGALMQEAPWPVDYGCDDHSIYTVLLHSVAALQV